MSHIFDGLQRSEMEHSGTKIPMTAKATELLERAEREALLQWGSETSTGDMGDAPLTGATLEPSRDAMQPGNLAREDVFPADAAQSAERVNVFSEFPAVATSPSTGSRLVCLTDKGSPAAEAFRLLEVRLRNFRKAKPLKKVLITSTSPEEGKTFAAANLACTLASGSKEKILLLGGDLRRPALAKLFGVKVNLGICDYLRGDRSLTSSIYRLEEPGIWLLPSGRPQGDPLEMIQSTKFPSLIEQLAGWFDWMIIDSPPVLPLADTTALARLADGILLVVRRGATEKRKLQKGLEAFETSKLIGALLNSSNGTADKDYYYYRQEAAPESGLDHSSLQTSDLPKNGGIFRAIRKAVCTPFTVKFRLGWNQKAVRSGGEDPQRRI